MNFYYRVRYKDGKNEELTATRHGVLGKEYYFVLPDGSERRISVNETKSCICTGFDAIQMGADSALGQGPSSDVAQKRAS